MTLPASGQITTDQIMAELGRSGQQFVSNDTGVCALAGKSVGAQIVVPNDFWGKSATPPASYSAMITPGSTTTGNAGANRYQRKTFSASTAAGAGGDSFTWAISNSSSGEATFFSGNTGSSVTLQIVGPALTMEDDFTLTVTAHDSASHTATASVAVTMTC